MYKVKIQLIMLSMHISVIYTTSKNIKLKIVGDHLMIVGAPHIDTLPIVAMCNTMIMFTLIHIR